MFGDVQINLLGCIIVFVSKSIHYFVQFSASFGQQRDMRMSKRMRSQFRIKPMQA